MLKEGLRLGRPGDYAHRLYQVEDGKHCLAGRHQSAKLSPACFLLFTRLEAKGFRVDLSTLRGKRADPGLVANVLAWQQSQGPTQSL